MRQLSLAALSILDAGPAGQIAASAAAGWNCVGLRLNPLLPTDVAVVGHPERETEVVTLMRETGLSLLEIGVFPIKPDMNVEALEPVLAFAAKFGARFVVCPVEDADEQRRLATFQRLCDRCARYRLDALIEFNPYSACGSLADALQIVHGAGRANAALVIDALHLSRSGGHPDDLRAVDPSLLKLVHFCDATPFTPGTKSVDELRRESRTARLLPGEGALPLHELLAVLPPDCPISVEAPSARLAGLSATERARETLRATMAFLATR
jgi:sugar phosphate isomerase/epimerase